MPGPFMKIARTVVRRIARSITLARYNDFTIAAYFRKQGAQIGENNRIEVRTLGAEPYLVRIGDHCTIGPNVGFICHDGATWLFTEEFPSLQKFGTIEVMDNCFIGVNATILGNVRIGPNAIVGACSVVTKDVPPNSVVAGNPARVVSTVEAFRDKALRIWEKQRPQCYFEGLENGRKYPPAYIQQMKFKELSKLREHLNKVCWSEVKDRESTHPQHTGKRNDS
jgi:acetyltransferase-like isoleucine patch superfamily enzyme